ncbi:iron donor protein CyaY [Buchnera aphidicola str. APS (Acyrthosiphon pisum)]|uniref:Iron-sulfur cluster assembly protein CyaY n=2 Tax=Buchnera aphidicola (Acyrthosiphon pisum) TaxID=118099 RepID=CYAY_BUCAI|nr:iron donor protein CyaY [Buchnera aphidicola]B8D8A9.1 RecName: Full=Iron-sulfur cluster assembly protein CyaY [Buchnera aphidicola str. Tuc7 (Acyrthosiphon pisum)]P57650.1 RecName: Full=Iron-sulfur cluster assembly protein CyaY [Buchnera aphidicola str. APS (Acyrthosiphon pisum)]pir/G84998/ cyaY protein [imported] - Buchnera sp. (strain APS) [Buchnera sp. (in: enterobacteria)]ADP66967.1 CyaY protein [Buchnera aphidicola str. TLW03 (Acyrthosiphon pisum)]ADP68037.1 CyaY protein [Buchnera aphi
MKKKLNTKKENNNFYILVNDLFLKIEDNLNLYENEIDIDYEIQDYVMTITFSNKTLIIINKQEPLQQIWLATMQNGYHFDYKNNQWICNRSNKNFWEIFENACSIQSNKDLIFCKK